MDMEIDYMLSFKKTKKLTSIIVLAVIIGISSGCGTASKTAEDPALTKLNNFAESVTENKSNGFGYPVNQNIQLTEFYKP